MLKNSAFDALMKQTLDFLLDLQTPFVEHCWGLQSVSPSGHSQLGQSYVATEELPSLCLEIQNQ